MRHGLVSNVIDTVTNMHVHAKTGTKAGSWLVSGGARVVEGHGPGDAQADDALLAGQQVDVHQVSAAHRRPEPADGALRQVNDQRRRHPDLQMVYSV